MRLEASEGETFLGDLSSPVLSFLVSAGTAVSFSCHTELGLQPGMCRVAPSLPSSHLAHFSPDYCCYPYNTCSC